MSGGSKKKADDASRADFWDRLPPIFVKELRQGLRANHFVWPFIVVQIAGIVCISMEYFGRHVASSGDFEFLFYGLLWVVFGGVLPLTLFGALQPELSSGRNVELLLMSNMTRWHIVLGKWFVGSTLSGLMLVSLIPYWLVRYFVGNVSDVSFEIANIVGIILTNATVNAIVIGASGYRNYVGRVFMIALAALFGWLSIALTGFRAIGLMPSSGAPFTGMQAMQGVIGVVLSAGLVIVLNLQLGRAKLRLFENPLDPPSSALIVTLIICAPIMIGISTGVSLAVSGLGGIVMTLILLILALLIDPGPGRKNRRWAHA